MDGLYGLCLTKSTISLTMFEPERSPFESSLFTFKSEKANRVASYCLLGGLCLGFFLGAGFALNAGLPFSLRGVWRWFRLIAFCTTGLGITGWVVGFALGTRIDKKTK